MPRFSPPARYLGTKDIRKELQRNQRYLRTWANRVGVQSAHIALPDDFSGINGTEQTIATSGAITNPQTSVYVVARYEGVAIAPDTTDRRVTFKVEISIDGGGAYDSGQDYEVTVAPVEYMPISLSHVYDAERALGDIHVRVTAQITSGDVSFVDMQNQQIIIQVIPE